MAPWEKRGVICWERLGPIIGMIQLLLVEVVMEQTQPGGPWARDAAVSRLTPCSAPEDVQKCLVSELWQ